MPLYHGSNYDIKNTSSVMSETFKLQPFIAMTTICC